jgi:hypothetical protein
MIDNFWTRRQYGNISIQRREANRLSLLKKYQPVFLLVKVAFET